MKLARHLAIAAFSAASLGMVAGCSVVRDQETVGQYIDGSAVTASVKAKLAEDQETSAANINVKTIEGGIVQLSGFAASEREKTRAGEIARSVEGVTRVQNDLVVRP